MARTIDTDGTEPTKTRKVMRDDGLELELPYCNICGCEMNEINIMGLCFWQPGFKWVRKFPGRLGTYLCQDCKQQQGFGTRNYICVPQAEGQDFVSALKDYLNLIEEHNKRLPSS